jgi:hypothetical protein
MSLTARTAADRSNQADERMFATATAAPGRYQCRRLDAAVRLDADHLSAARDAAIKYD